MLDILKISLFFNLEHQWIVIRHGAGSGPRGKKGLDTNESRSFSTWSIVLRLQMLTALSKRYSGE
jgi:hypothetical protein